MTFTNTTASCASHILDLRDRRGNGYRLEWYPEAEAMAVHVWRSGIEVWAEYIEDGPVGDAEYMLTTASSVGRAIMDDKATGDFGDAFQNGYATFANWVD